MQVSNNINYNNKPSFKGMLYLRQSTLKEVNGILKNIGSTTYPTTPQQDTLLKKAVNYFLDGKENKILDKDDSMCFSEILNKIIGKELFVNNQPKKLERILDSDYFVYSDKDFLSKNSEYVAIKAKDSL